MMKSLKNDVFLFSALKTHSQLLEASQLLMTEDNKVKSFSQFSKDIEAIKSGYNQNYLEAEYQFAIASAQSAANWSKVSTDYDLQYRTAEDDRVRATHQKLHNITLPADDEFWIYYYPPNGWKCRCNALEVRKGKYDVSNRDNAMAAGEIATTKIGADGKNKLEIFRFNPGMQKVVFPPSHPYQKVMGAKQVVENVEARTGFRINNEVKTLKDVNVVMIDFAKEHPEYFQRGFKSLTPTRKANANGHTDMNGNIALKSERINLIKDALNNIRQGKPTTAAQEDALSTLHHEMWHNANKPGMLYMTPKQQKTMEMANEFVSRKTLPEFMQKIGGKLETESLTETRKTTGYNRMVVNYDKIVDWAKCDRKMVVELVKQHLVDGKYNDQLPGLVKAIIDSSDYKLKEKDVQALIGYAQNDAIDSEIFEGLLNRSGDLLVK